MSKLKQLCMKTAVLSTIFCTATSINSYAQVYVQDYTSLHLDPNKKQWVEQHAIYRDDNETAYYIAQGLRPRDTKQTFLGITKCDKDMNVISVWEYFNEPKEMTIRTETIDEMEGYNALILVGHYSNHSNINNPFVMSIDKYSGAVNWFKWFPYEGLKLTSLVAEKDYVLVTGERPFKYGEGIFKYSASAGIIMRLDKNGDLVWEREFEDDKYGSTDYGAKQVYNSMNDIKRLDDKYFVAVGSTNNWVYKEQPQNLWDVDGMITLITEDGDINYAYMLGNVLPMASNGQQSIQYELLQHVTVDHNDKTVVMVGERLEHPQNYISDQSPTPKAWGLWATKFDPYNQYYLWSYRYQYKDDYYRISDPEVEHDEKSQYGISYNFPKYNAMAMKLDYYGGVMYHRHHYLSGFNSGEEVFNDITHAFEYTNMTIVGEFEPDIDQYRSSYGWNVQAFDNILEKCEMENYKIEPQKAPYEIDKVDYRKYKVELVDEPIKEDKIELVNKVICKKQEVWFKQSNTGGPTSSVTQNTEGTNVQIRINGSLMQQNTGGTYNAVLINALGQRMLETGNFTDHFNLNISGLPAGIYFLQVTGADMHESHTILVR